MSSPTYQPLPQREADVEQQLKREADVFAGVGEYEHVVDSKPAFTWKRLLILVVSAAALFQATSYFLGPPTTKRMHRLGTPCRGSHRNLSSVAKLPTHYTLPSGDKIPSVALGACAN